MPMPRRQATFHWAFTRLAARKASRDGHVDLPNACTSRERKAQQPVLRDLRHIIEPPRPRAIAADKACPALEPFRTDVGFEMHCAEAGSGGDLLGWRFLAREWRSDRSSENRMLRLRKSDLNRTISLSLCTTISATSLHQGLRSLKHTVLVVEPVLLGGECSFRLFYDGFFDVSVGRARERLIRRRSGLSMQERRRHVEKK